MGLLDSLMGAITGGSGSGSGGGLAAMVPALLQSFAGNQATGGQPGLSGGLAAIVQQFEQAGMGQQVQSWIGTGQNEPVSSDQVQSAIGQDRLQGMAGAAGVPVSMLVSVLAQNLPMLIDRMTPHGRLPTEAEAEQHVQGLGA